MKNILMKIILASSSPRRKELLKDIVSGFEVISSDFDESTIRVHDFNNNYGAYVRALSEKKAESVAAQYKEALVIGGDSVVVLNNEIFGKPADESDARRALAKLSGKTHQVYTGACVIYHGKVSSDYDVTDVTFKKLEDLQTEKYIKSGEWKDRAGSYAIQEGLSKKFVASYNGSYNTVVGLPTEKLIPILKEFGVRMQLNFKN